MLLQQYFSLLAQAYALCPVHDALTRHYYTGKYLETRGMDSDMQAWESNLQMWYLARAHASILHALSVCV
jgi:hypothetical protein